MEATLKQVSKDTLKGSLLHRLVADRRSKEDALAFPADFAPAAGVTEVEVTLSVLDADADLVRVSSEEVPGQPAIRKAQVDIDSGTATGKQLKQTAADFAAVDASIQVLFENGVATFRVKVAGAGTVVLGITDTEGYGLTATDTITITFS